jgi:hypothetical protein
MYLKELQNLLDKVSDLYGDAEDILNLLEKEKDYSKLANDIIAVVENIMTTNEDSYTQLLDAISRLEDTDTD